MNVLKVTRKEAKTAAYLQEEWEHLLLLAQSVNFKLIRPEFKSEVVGFVIQKNEFWAHMKKKYQLDTCLEYRVNQNGYLECERGESIWLLWEVL